MALQKEDLGKWEIEQKNKKILQSNVNWENYKKIATTEIELARDLFSQLHVSPSQDQLDCCVTRLSDSLYNTATSCIINTPTSKEENNELDLINTSLQLLLDKSTSAYDRFIHGSSSADDWHAARLLAVKENKKVYFSREAKKWTTVMSNSDTKEIWNRINWKGDIDDSKSFTKTMPPAKDLADHFMTKGDSHDSINLSALPTDQHNELLDRPITLAEVEKSALLIKEKSTSDGWCPKMIRSIHSSLYPVIVLSLILYYLLHSSLLNGAESLQLLCSKIKDLLRFPSSIVLLLLLNSFINGSILYSLEDLKHGSYQQMSKLLIRKVKVVLTTFFFSML